MRIPQVGLSRWLQIDRAGKIPVSKVPADNSPQGRALPDVALPGRVVFFCPGIAIA
jgi:hypothetical protein